MPLFDTFVQELKFKVLSEVAKLAYNDDLNSGKIMEIAEKIMAASDFGEIKALGRQVRNYDDRIWSGIRQIVVYEGLVEKFRQNPDLKEQLLATGDALLAECAFNDRIWAIGLTMQDANRLNIEKWRGQNLLGFSLMQVREKLSKE